MAPGHVKRARRPYLGHPCPVHSIPGILRKPCSRFRLFGFLRIFSEDFDKYYRFTGAVVLAENPIFLHKSFRFL